ncbi:MAG: 2-octaprenyl-3-methyl-6-methoxy-1,4-benzoquinol hydroxylase [Psychromonas sp.]|jgi:2-octaprenyl-3-methyl-6-methoxy-1,4-benzoquinol hydroxylase|uniref:FAD-dependent monooxygenase n=1 Tax=Psychromonas sp. TaxID=1884585 RepID=UPI0039E544C7
MQSRQVIVVGGGLVGTLTALLLAKQGDSIHLVEKKPFIPPIKSAAFDLRVSAFSAQSQKLLALAGVWDCLPKNRVCAYQRLQTWERGSQKLCFDSADLELDALGYIVENRWIQAVLWQALQALPNVTFYEGRQVSHINNSDSAVSVDLDNGQQIKAQLLVACDGGNSTVRQLLNIPVTAWDYRQHCMLVNIKTDSVEQNITWQEFRETGPCAFLPLAENNASLVWYHSPQKIRQLSGLSNSQLKEVVIAEFPALPFDFTVEDKGAFPLIRRHAQTYFKGSCVLLGDAAHTINPLAGQGVNLGFKDAECLVNLLQSSPDLPMSILLKRYECKRKPANLLMQSAMDLFYKGSKCELDSVRWLRKGVLHLAQNSGAVKNRVMKYAMGL